MKNIMHEAILTCSHNLCFEQKKKNEFFSSEKYHFYSRENRSILLRHVIVMKAGLCLTLSGSFSNNLTHGILGNFSYFLSSADFFSKLTFLKNSFRKYHQNVKQFGP